MKSTNYIGDGKKAKSSAISSRAENLTETSSRPKKPDGTTGKYNILFTVSSQIGSTWSNLTGVNISLDDLSLSSSKKSPSNAPSMNQMATEKSTSKLLLVVLRVLMTKCRS